MPRRWSGEKDTGPRRGTAKQIQRVIAFLRAECTGIERALPVALVARRLGISGRTLRDILAQVDGIEFVIAQADGLMWIALSAPETLAATRSLRSRAREIRDRADRRDEMARKLPGAELL